MKCAGIIAEFNPLHNGHAYLIKKVKEITNVDLIVVVMSGSFTQQGNIAIHNKYVRAKNAIISGADIVIELPTTYALSSAEYFAKGAVNILDKLNIIDFLCFGSEDGNVEALQNIADVLINDSNKIWENIREELKQGQSFAKTRANVLSKYFNEEIITILNKPNNILAIEYLKALNELKSKIVPVTIKREISSFNENSLNINEKGYTSATSIRNAVKLKQLENLKEYVPDCVLEDLQNIKPLFNEEIFQLIKTKIISYGTDSKYKIETINEVTEGLENKILKEINNTNSFEELVEKINSKRYTQGKIKRILINILLDINKEFAKKSFEFPYAHILKISNKAKENLGDIFKNSKIPIITSYTAKNINGLPENIKSMIELDIIASNIHSSLSNEDMYIDYTNKL